jgi:purine nucleosidase
VQVLFDHDGGIDDLLSLTMLLAMDHVDLRGVVVTPADSYLRPALSATQKILRRFGRSDIPVAAGTLRGENPFPRAWRAHPYAVDALPILNEPTTPLVDPVPTPGHVFLAEKLAAAREPVTVLVTGPATNLAAALALDPALPDKIGEVVWMGGALHVPGNVHDYEHDGSAEWNAYWDPEATRALLASGAPVTLFPLDATNHVPVTMEWLLQLARQREYSLSDFAGQCWAMTVGAIPAYAYIYHMWDTLATGYLGAPELVTVRKLACDVDVAAPSAGRTRPVDLGGFPIRAGFEVDVPRFLDYVLQLLRRDF